MEEYTLNDSLEPAGLSAVTIVSKYGAHILCLIVSVMLIALIANVPTIAQDISVLAGGLSVLGLIGFGTFYSSST